MRAYLLISVLLLAGCSGTPSTTNAPTLGAEKPANVKSEPKSTYSKDMKRAFDEFTATEGELVDNIGAGFKDLKANNKVLPKRLLAMNGELKQLKQLAVEMKRLKPTTNFQEFHDIYGKQTDLHIDAYQQTVKAMEKRSRDDLGKVFSVTMPNSRKYDDQVKAILGGKKIGEFLAADE